MENKSTKRSCLFSTFLSYFNAFFSLFFFMVLTLLPFFIPLKWTPLSTAAQLPFAQNLSGFSPFPLPCCTSLCSWLLLTPHFSPPLLPPSLQQDTLYPPVRTRCTLEGAVGTDLNSRCVTAQVGGPYSKTAAQCQGKGQGLVPVWRLVRGALSWHSQCRKRFALIIE